MVVGPVAVGVATRQRHCTLLFSPARPPIRANAPQHQHVSAHLMHLAILVALALMAAFSLLRSAVSPRCPRKSHPSTRQSPQRSSRCCARCGRLRRRTQSGEQPTSRRSPQSASLLAVSPSSVWPETGSPQRSEGERHGCGRGRWQKGEGWPPRRNLDACELLETSARCFSAAAVLRADHAVLFRCRHHLLTFS